MKVRKPNLINLIATDIYRGRETSNQLDLKLQINNAANDIGN